MSAMRSTTRWPRASLGRFSSSSLDRRRWQSRAELASAIFEYIEAFYNPKRRHSSIGNLSPIEYESLHTDTTIAA